MTAVINDLIVCASINYTLMLIFVGLGLLSFVLSLFLARGLRNGDSGHND